MRKGLIREKDFLRCVVFVFLLAALSHSIHPKKVRPENQIDRQGLGEKEHNFLHDLGWPAPLETNL